MPKQEKIYKNGTPYPPRAWRNWYANKSSKDIALKKAEQKEGFGIYDRKQLKECFTCGRLKVSSPTPDGDEICPDCGDKEMMDYEEANH